MISVVGTGLTLPLSNPTALGTASTVPVDGFAAARSGTRAADLPIMW